MKIGVLGSGIVGRALAAGFIKHEHEAMLGTRDPNKKEITDWIRGTPGAKAGTFEEAARFGELIVIAALARAVESIIELAGPANFAGKTVIDATNPLADGPPVNGVLKYTTGPNESLGEWIQTKLPAPNVVKAFNSVGNALMVNPEFSQGTPTMFFCGNSEKRRRGLRP
jgi:predicted dinucleotide-binding enzyme